MRDGAAGDERGAQRRRAVKEVGCAESPEQRTASAARQTAVSEANRRARDAQRAKRAEGRRMPARRVETAQRAPQGSLVAKRRPQNQNRNRRHESDRRQQHRDLRKMVVLPEEKERLDHWHRGASSVAAAAQCGAEGDALREGDIAAPRSREATGHWMGVKRARREQGVRERERRQRRRRGRSARLQCGVDRELDQKESGRASSQDDAARLRRRRQAASWMRLTGMPRLWAFEVDPNPWTGWQQI